MAQVVLTRSVAVLMPVVAIPTATATAKPTSTAPLLLAA